MAPEQSPDRPVTDAEFAASEARITRAVLEARRRLPQAALQRPLRHRVRKLFRLPQLLPDRPPQLGNRVQFALIHMPNGGVSPTNMVESLASHLRRQVYPKLDPGLIEWFDVIPPRTYSSVDKLSISAVSLQHANGVTPAPPGTQPK